jgi:predicted nuclease of restriction endonuclease-like (RecB) superfamily
VKHIKGKTSVTKKGKAGIVRRDVYTRIRQILETARSNVARTVNTTQVVANWLVWREIVEEEQGGSRRASYGVNLLEDLSARLFAEFGTGYSEQNLRYMRQFYREYPHLLSDVQIRHTVRGKSAKRSIRHTVRGKSGVELESLIHHAPRGESWTPGLLHPHLAWSLYRQLLKVETAEARAFYEIESIKNHWSARELERQINSLLFERLAKSKDKTGVMKLATKGQEIAHASDVFKDPVIVEFLGLPESSRMVESDLEQALINNLQLFLLELGKGFAFVSRQERLTLDGDHLYVDLVFYHTILKCLDRKSVV